MTSIAMLEDIVASIGVKMREAAEAQKKMTETVEQSQKAVEQAQKKMSETVEQVMKKMGGIDNRLGEIVEMIIIPGVKKKMNELGYDFSITSPNKKFSNADGKFLTEVDLMLENCKEVMV